MNNEKVNSKTSPDKNLECDKTVDDIKFEENPKISSNEPEHSVISKPSNEVVDGDNSSNHSKRAIDSTHLNNSEQLEISNAQMIEIDRLVIQTSARIPHCV